MKPLCFRPRISPLFVAFPLIFLLVTFSFAGPIPEHVAHKLPPALAQELDLLLANPVYDYPIPVLVQLDPDFFDHGKGLKKRPDSIPLGLVHAYATRLPAQAIFGVLHSPFVQYVTVDAVLRPHSNPLTSTIGLEQDLVDGRARNQLGYQGDGLAVAVFDSGIRKHSDLNGTSRSVESLDFTSGAPVVLDPGVTTDGYGHGTHVSGIIGGNGVKANGDISGVAPLAEFVHVKVLDDEGLGLTSNLIAAIDWVIQNKDLYNIRVANLSLGHPAVESYVTDPLCQAVRAMVEAGIVTVVSAGNLGRTAEHPEVWGGITSPGTEPTVITVGAVNTQGTLTHSDDIAASYSSRGYTVPDGLFKPDLVAPGNGIPSLQAKNCYIGSEYPELKIGKEYLSLSGSSMATAFVSGTAALMLEANPALHPNLVKAILLLTASKMDDLHPLEQGNGFLRVIR